MEKIITYWGKKAKVACDEKCNKAWGSARPRVYLEISELKVYGLNGESIWPDDEEIDVDNYALLSDLELGEAPVDNGSYHCDIGKPRNKEEMLNKWCLNECERCRMSDVGMWEQPLQLPDLNQRFYNVRPHARGFAAIAPLVSPPQSSQ